MERLSIHGRIPLIVIGLIWVFIFSLASAESIKVGLTRLKETDTLIIHSQNGGDVYLDGKIILRTESEINLIVTIALNGLKISSTIEKKKINYNGKQFKIIPYVLVSIENKNKGVKKYYEGEIIICKKDKSLIAINQIEFDKYLAEVVAKEIGIEADIEALKAQAVASRTFAICNFQKHKKDGFNVCDSRFACCQVYDGTYTPEGTGKTFNQKVYDAVSQTKAEVLTYQGECVEALFHSCCGGKTCDSKDVWTNTDKNEWLIGVDDIDESGEAYCKNSPRFKWKTEISKKIINQCFDSYLRTEKLSLVKNSSNATIYICMGAKKLTIIDFRRKLARLEYKGVDSNFLEIEEKDDSYIFSGYGFGHRVGMCQSGAKEMAQRGFNYRDILKHYYPNTNISKLRNFKISHR